MKTDDHPPVPSLAANAMKLCLVVLCCAAGLGASDPKADEAKSLIPWKELDEKARAKVEGVVNNSTVFHQTPSEVFECSPQLYQLLLHDPILTLELWRSLGTTDATLESVGPNQFEGKDGHASSGRWEFVYRSPELNIIYAEGQYRGPLLGTTLETKSVLIVRTAYIQERDGKHYVKHQLSGFVKADSGSLKPLAKALRPIFHKSIEATMQESLWFVSLMCRYTVYDPHTIARSLDQVEHVAPAAKEQMQKMLVPLLATTPERKDIARSDQSRE